LYPQNDNGTQSNSGNYDCRPENETAETWQHTSREQIEWLSFRGGDDVLNTYEALLSLAESSLISRILMVQCMTLLTRASMSIAENAIATM
jgi:hypothetical protein